VNASDTTTAEESSDKYEGADHVEGDSDGVDWNVDEAGVAGSLRCHYDAQCDQRQTRKLQASQ